MTIERREFHKGLLAVAAGALLPAAPAAAQALRSFDLVAPAGPGGGYDQLARAIQDVLQTEKLAAGVRVVNVPGAGGTIGLAQLVTSRKPEPDLMVTGLGMVGAVLVNKSPVSLDQVTPLARLQGEYQPLVVGASSPLKTLDDLIKRFKENPARVTWGGFAPGSPDHILTGLVVKAIGGDVKRMNYVPVGAGGEMLAQIIGGNITVATGGLNEFDGQIKVGKIRALGLSSPERLPGVDIPTFKEQGVDATLVNWRGIVAAPGIKPDDAKAFDAALARMVASAPWRRLLETRGWVDLHLPSDRFAAFLKEEQTRVAALLKEIGLT